MIRFFFLIFLISFSSPPEAEARDTMVAEGGKATLTEQERGFIQSRPRVRVAFMDSFAPFSFFSEGTHQGFAKDYYERLSRKTGLEFVPVYGNWAENLERFKRKEVDLIDGISYRKERETYTLFTRPYYTIPLALFTREGFGRFTGIAQLYGKRVGINRGA